MSKYEEYVRIFHENYEEPTVDGHIVGLSGLTPNAKVHADRINHEELGGLKGGDFDGYYHVTGEELEQFNSYQGQIDTLENDTNQAITSARQEASTAVNNLRNETAQNINAARVEASTAVNTLRNDTAQNINAARQEAATAVNNLSTKTTQNINAARMEAASSVSTLREEKNRDISDLRTQTNTAISVIRNDTERKISEISSEVETTQTELNGRMSTVEGSQAEIETEQEQISARLDEIVGSVTEDSEILDARVDADGNTHPNLGANIRSVHESVKASESATRGREQVLYEHVREQDAELTEAILTETLDRRERQESLQGVIANWEKRSQEINGQLQEGLNDLSAGEMKAALNLSEESTKSRQAEKVILREIGRVQEGVTDLSEGEMKTVLDLSEESIKRKHAEKVSLREREHLQEGINENADSVMKLALQMTGSSAGGTIYRNPLDWSRAESIAIPEPRCAIVNFTGINAMPTSKTVEFSAVMEFWDMQGNYFRKKITCAAQGSSSMGFIKKNVKFDLLNEDGSEFELKIGDWVSQDGFHLKAYYTDYFRGVGVTSYKFWDDIMRFNGTDKDRPYKKALGVTEGVTPTGSVIQDIELQLETGALCHPDGFPCIVYLNGEFYGIFSWQIKKQRKNYHMDKSTIEHIHIDGTLYPQYFWGGVINWTQFEIRNPNKLYTMDGKKYDGDAPKELIDETSEKYDPDNKDHVRTAKVKGYIQSFVDRFQEMRTLYTGGNIEAAKAKFDELFDAENMRDYLIFSDIVKNTDGFGKNWQWTTYDGVKWWVNAYDLDMSYGGMFNGTQITAPLTNHVNMSNTTPGGYIVFFYVAEMEQRYKELRDAGIIETEHILAYLRDWVSRIGTANYELEYEKWPNSPCIKNYTDSIYRVKKWLDTEIANMDRVYHYTR